MTFSRRVSASVPFCILLFAFASLAIAQTDTATVSGTIVDKTGAVVPGVEVQTTNSDTNVGVSTTTNGSGVYVLVSLKPGRYRMSVVKQGFKQVNVTDIILNVQDVVSRNFTLEVGAASESLTVTAEAEHVNMSDATVSTVVDRQFVENIPLNGRSFQSLIMLTPGVVVTSATFAEQGQFSINGQRASANYFTVDGVSANFSINAGGGTGQAGAGELPALNASGGFSNLVSVDALQEFRIQTSTYAPEYGRSPGGQISLVTRSGTNALHGTLFDYLRNDVLDANNWFADRRGLAKPKERQNDFGGVIGGPIIKDKTFFFFSYEGLRLRQPQVSTTLVPSLSLRAAAPPAVQTLLNAFPIPNGIDQGNGLAQFTTSYSDPTTMDAASLKIDHQMGKVTMFARYDYSPSNNIANLGSSEPNNPRPTLFNTRTLTYGATWIVTPTMTNEFRSNWSRQDGATLLTLDSNGGAVPFSPSVYPGNFPQQNSFFEVYVAGVTEILGRNGEGTQGQLNFVDNFTWVHGNHQFKFGVDYRYLFPSALSRAADLDVLFLTTAAAQQGLAEIATAARSPRVDYAYSNFSAYAQDTWKLTQRLTATYGLRWDLNPPPHGRNGTTLYAANDTNNLSALAFATAGTPLWNTQYSNFAPRVGLAYRLNESGTNVIRGGFGMFYDLPAGAISNVVILSPNVVSGPTLLNVPYPPSSVTIPALSTNPPYANVTVADRNLASPFTLEWNIALEHAFDKNETITVSYIGANGRNLIGQEQYFSLNANFPTVSVIRSDRSSNYNALQAQYQRHLSHGLQGLASYTWAHSLDNASNSSSSLVPGTAIDPSIDYGPSDYDIRHTFSGALTYEVPMAGPAAAKAILGHWSLDSIFTARSSMPVNVTVSRNLGYGTYSFRPDLVSGVPDYLTNPNVPGGWLINNTPVSANQLGPFLVSPQLRQGTLGRNALSGFPMDELDFAVRRQINLTERYNLQIRAEFFNILNHPNFANPSGALGSATPTGATTFSTSTFGQSPSMLNAALGSGGQVGGFNPLYGIGGPRSIQLSLKFGF